MRLLENSKSSNLYSRPECHVVSKAFPISKNTAGVDVLLLKFRFTWSVSLIHWSVVLWSARKPNWLAHIKFLSSVCFWIVLFSNSMPVVDTRLIGRKFWFRQDYEFSTFEGGGKWPSRRQWLNKCVKCTRYLLGRWRRHPFGMPLKPYAFPNFKEINRKVFSDGSRQGFDLSLHMSSVVTVTQVMSSELVF
jgi:hypothetical protein